MGGRTWCAVMVATVSLGLVWPVSAIGQSATGTSSSPATVRLSVHSDGQQFPGGSDNPQITPDGRFVVFETNEVIDGRDTRQIYVHDVRLGETVRVSVNSAGEPAEGSNREASITDDGRYVAFESTAFNIVPDLQRSPQIYVHDRVGGTTRLISVAQDGQPGGGRDAAISGDGRFVAFRSRGDGFVAGDTNEVEDVFVYDRSSGSMERVSVASNGAQANDASRQPRLSPRGRFVVFQSMAFNLAPADGNDSIDVFLRDRAAGTTEMVSLDPDGHQFRPGAGKGSVSADGRFVAFEGQNATGGFSPDINVFVRDRRTAQTQQVDISSDGQVNPGDASDPVISSDGQMVAFTSRDSRLVGGDTNSKRDVFVRDLGRETTVRVSVPDDPELLGSEANRDSMRPAISTDGGSVAFSSWADNLVHADTNDRTDVFVRQRQDLEGKRTHVALGDSYSSGNGARWYFAGTAEEDKNDCRRSRRAYPQLIRSDEPAFWACTGATTDNFLSGGASGPGQWGEPAQLTHVVDESRLVTLTIGGNDVGFGDVLRFCFALLTRDCHDQLKELNGGEDPVDIAIDRLYDRLVDVFERLAQKGPNAAIWVVAYPRFLTGETCSAVGGVGSAALLSTAEQHWINERVTQLNDVLEVAAGHVAGVTFAKETEQAFAGHELCSDREWSHGLTWPTVHSFHPNARGHRAIADALVRLGIVGAERDETTNPDLEPPAKHPPPKLDIQSLGITDGLLETVRIGGRLLVSHSGLVANAIYRIVFFSEATPVGEAQADEQGRLRFEFELPEGTQPGFHVVTVQGPSSSPGAESVLLVGSTTIIPELTIRRIAGATRYATAARISRQAFPDTVETVYIATGDKFPDALAGSAAAGREGAPVLLVTRNGIPSATSQELRRLSPNRIVILGGTSAVSQRVENELEDHATATVVRLAGPSRFDTAAAISQAAFTAPTPVAYIATGGNFPDALAGAAAAIRHDAPILLTQKNQIPAATARELRRLQPGAITVLGGPSAVSGGVTGELDQFTDGTVQRLAGTTRYETAGVISQDTVPSDVPPDGRVYIATGRDFPDALTGSVLAGRNRSPVLLVPSNGPIPTRVEAELRRLVPAEVVLLGGPNAISDELAQEIHASG